MIGTTPIHTFELPFDVSTIKKVEIAYSQNNKVIITKRETDCQMSGNIIAVELTQEDTFKFNPHVVVEIQLRIVSMNDKVTKSKIERKFPGRCLSNEVL